MSRNKEKQRAWDRLHGPAYRHSNREHRNAHNRAYALARYATLRADALRILGNKCACPGCEVSELLFLTIDHIHGREKGSMSSALLEAWRSGWDKTKFQILCANCNQAKRDRGFCPVHQIAPASNGHTPGVDLQQILWSL
jgi:5-methylcytosine-specific restriction endonuclease McrA